MRFHLIALSLLAPLAMVSAASAQERTAAGALDTQMTWSSLAAQAQAASNKADAVNTRIDQAIICARKGKIYAPGLGDTQGCLEPSSNTNVDLTTIVNSLTTLNSTVSSVSNNFTNNTTSVSNIIACNKSGLIFNGTSCVSPAGKANCSLQVVSSGSSGGNCSSCNNSVNSCPSGYQQTGDPGGSTFSSRLCARIVCN